ncbi:MAG: transcription antitermination factor NusB [Candidatus Dormibacteria bacterium]
MGRRHHARELALKILFELDADPAKVPAESVAWHALESDATADVRNFAEALVGGVLANREAINEMISDASRNWDLGQMAKVDRLILQIAVFELRFSREVPLRAAINESLELAKTFSSDESSRFVNGVLGKVVAGLAPAASD